MTLISIISSIKCAAPCMHPDEIKQYVDELKIKHPDLTSITLSVYGDYVDITYFVKAGQGGEIRRIKI